MSGGSITTTRSGGGGAVQFDTTNAITFNPTTFDTDITLTLGASAAQSLTTDKTLFVVQARGTGVKTLTSTAASNGIAQLQMFDANSATPSSRTTLKLGSNLTSTSGAGMPAAQSFGNTHESGRIDLGIDTAGFTLDLSAGAGSGVWTPNASTQSGVTNTVWTLSGSGAIKANAFVFTNSGVTTDVSSGTTLIASGANSTVNNLGGTGTINADSIFRYAGTAATNTPATLTFNRNIGDLEVTAGALRLLSNAVGTVQDLRVSGGTLDLQGGTNTFATISLTGGTLANGTYQTSEANFTNLQTGTVSGSLVGTKKLIKNSAGTLTLSGFNNLNNNALEVLAGTVAITTASALNGVSSLDMKGGTLDLGGTTNNKFITLTNGSVIQNGTIARTSVTGWTLYDGTISAALTTSGSGTINITKAGSGTLILSGTNAYAGTTTVSAGKLVINGDQSASTGAVTVAAGATLGGTGTIGGATTISGIHSPGNSPGIQAFGSDLIYSGASPGVVWELTANTVVQGSPTPVFDQIIVGGNLNFSVPTQFSLNFSGAGSAVDWSDALWSSDITGTAGWLVYDVAGTLADFSNLSVSVENWADGSGDLFDTVRPDGAFGFYQDGNDVYLNYTVPEPSTYSLLALAAALAVQAMRRRR